MNTLPSPRSVNTFQAAPSLRPGANAAKGTRANSLYLPSNGQDDESRSHLLPNDPFQSERRAHTLGRMHLPSGGSRNLTNPLFDSVGSLDQPWYRSYLQPITMSSNQDSIPTVGPETSGFTSARDVPPSIRVPTPGRQSPYSTSVRRLKEPSIREFYKTRRAPQRICMPCTGGICCERESNHYSAPDELLSHDDWFREKPSPKPWAVCLLTLSIVFDLLLLLVMAVVVFFLNCSSDSMFYADRRMQTMCANLWSDWIPLHHRTFRCPALPPSYDETRPDMTNPQMQQYLYRFWSEMATPAPNTYAQPGGVSGGVPERVISPKDLPMSPFIQPEAWDADLGLMPPPNLHPITHDSAFGMTTTRLYGPAYERPQPTWLQNREQWLRLNPVAPYSSVSTDFVVIGCIILPLVVIVCLEFAASCLLCCQPGHGRSRQRLVQCRRVIGRLYRFCVTYVFGLLTVILITLILKSSIGRLRPNFISICKPAKTVCPRWSALLEAAGYRYTTFDSQQDYSSDPQLLSFLAEESAKRGFVLVPRTTTPPPDQSIRGTKNEKGAFSDRDCTEKRILRLKYARTSFPSLCASVTMYATVFVAVYITHMLRYLRKTCFCIPLSLLLGGCLANVFLGLGRVVYRENWLEDVIAGWGVGLLIAGYVLYRSLHSKQKSSVTTAAEIRRQLNQIQSLLQSNHEYRHNEVKYMKYL